MGNVHLKVAGTGSYLPPSIIGNNYFEGKLLYKYDSNGERISDGLKITSEEIYKMSGILTRRYASKKETPSSMGSIAAIRAIDKSGIDPKSLTGIILATISEPFNIPSGACKIQEQIASHYNTRIDNCISYDVSAACSGFILAAGIANSMVSSRNGNYLVIGADDISRITQDDDRNIFLFGAGAGASVFIPTKSEKGIAKWIGNSNPYDGNLDLIIKDKNNLLRMPNGGKVMKKAVASMVSLSKDLKRQIGRKDADIYIPHQANERILKMVENQLKEKNSLVYRNIKDIGNVSSATCPIALDSAIEDGTIKEGHRVIMPSFGGGLISAALALQF